MANSLDKNLPPGTIVIIQKKGFIPLTDYRFQVKDGFGCNSFTRGTALPGTWLVDGEECRLEGWQIDEKETLKYWKEQGFDIDAAWETYIQAQREKNNAKENS